MTSATEHIRATMRAARAVRAVRAAPPLAVPVAVVVLIASVVLATGFGAVSVPGTTVWAVLVHHVSASDAPVAWSAGIDNIVWQLRLPRVLLGAMVGGGLALVGAVLQAITRNPLADPHLLGVSSGAAFGAVLAIVHIGMIFGALTVPVFAFVGALTAGVIVLRLARGGAGNTDRLILGGVAIAFVAMALANLLIFIGDRRATQTALFWMLGGLGLARWSHLAYPAAALTVAFAFFLPTARHLNALMAGPHTAATLGVNVPAYRAAAFAVTALLTGVLVAFSGAIGFVGLLVPHVARLFVGADMRRLLPAAAFFGAVFLVWVDVIARTVLAPEDLPVGVATGILGGLFFIYLLRRRA